MPARGGQRSKVQVGLEKARAFLMKGDAKGDTKRAGWKDLPPAGFSAPPPGVSPEEVQDFCLGEKPLATGQPRPAAQRAGLRP